MIERTPEVHINNHTKNQISLQPEEKKFMQIESLKTNLKIHSQKLLRVPELKELFYQFNRV